MIRTPFGVHIIKNEEIKMELNTVWLSHGESVPLHVVIIHNVIYAQANMP